MKYILINSWCKKGSTGNIVYDFYQYLIQQGHDVYFFHGRESAQDDKNIIRLTSKNAVKVHAGLARVTGLQGFFSNHETNKLINFIDSFEPDYVYLFNLHGYYINEFKLLEYLNLKNQKTVYMLFDEYPYLGKCCFSEDCRKFEIKCSNCPKVRDYPSSLYFDRSELIFNKKKQVYMGWTNLVFTGVEYIQKKAMISALARNIPFIAFDMGVDLDDLYYPRETALVRKKLMIRENCTVVLTVGFSSDKRKGISKFVELSRMFDVNTVFINIGYDKDVTEDLPSNFIPIKYVADLNEMAEYYSLADVYVTTSSGEAMSNACLEAMGCGTPIVAFDKSGMSYLGLSPNVNLAAYDDLTMMKKLIIACGRKNNLDSTKCREYALKRFRRQDFLLHLYEAGKHIDKVVER
ncbi:glycosyltransferase [Pelosinus sp. sgz500959]|uniref:glycosyltransferase n=1 Tax=Pelosinus sp. sgz500959 TaxID=3242472 RepID=UPI00366D69D3